MFSWTNPSLASEPGILRDPHITKVDNRWYMVATPAPFWKGPVAGIPMWVSDDLLAWERVGLILDRGAMPETAWYRDRLWAPEIHYAEGAYYLTFNARNELTAHRHSIALARAESITGPYFMVTTDRPLITLGSTVMHYDPSDASSDRYLVNDASLFTDGAGQHFVAYCNLRGIHGQQLDLPTGSLIGEEFLIHPASATGWDTKVEGPSILQRNGRLYCFFSSYTRSYEVGVTMAEDMHGPWTPDPANPLVHPAGPFTASGHNCVFEGPDGGPWMAYHVESDQFEGERLAIDPIDFAADGSISVAAPSWTPQVR